MTEVSEFSIAVPDKAAVPQASILLVDDSPANLLALRVVLEGLGHRLVEVTSGEEALRHVKTDKFAVILLDLYMPGMDGFETAALIRETESDRHTPIIFITAEDIARGQLEKAYRLGAIDFLTKPVQPVILQAKVRSFVDLFIEKQRVKMEAEQLQLLVDGTTDYAMFMLDPDGHIATWNSGAALLKGYKSHEIIGQHFSRFYPEEAIASGWPQYELETASREGRFEDEGWRLRKDGTRFWANVVITALRTEQGQLRGFSKITRDLTRRRRVEEALRQSEERFRLLVEGVRDYAIFLLDPQGLVASWNSGAQRLKQYTATEIIGKHFSIFYPAEVSRSGWPAHELEVAKAEGRFEDEGWRVRKDGTQFWANVVITALRSDSGELRGFSKITRDMTERKRAEENARRLVEIAAAKRLAEDHARQLREFLATLAHELRNPLAPINNSLEILKLPGVDHNTTQQMHGVLERQVQHLVRLVDDLLDVSRVMQGKIELRSEPVELAAVIARAIETAKPLIEAQGHRLTVELGEASLLLHADPVRLIQVFGNLINNAAKYAEPEANIWVLAQREGDEAIISVRDSGIGIAADMLPHIFELFTQADHASSKAQGGLGIGLTLVKNLVELHRGSIEAHSAGLGKGSEFIVRLPLASAKSAANDHAGAQQRFAGLVPQRLLVADDNEDAAISLATLLRLQGHEVCVAYDGASALEMAKMHHPSLVFLDLGMPGMDGYEVARQLRDIPELKQTVLAALTGWGQPEDRRRTAEAGFDHHLVKPPDAHVVEGLLAGLSHRH